MPDNSLKVKFNFFQIQKSSNFPYGIHQVLSNIMARGTAERQQNVNGSLRILDALHSVIALVSPICLEANEYGGSRQKAMKIGKCLL